MCQADDWFQTTCIIRRGLGCIWASVDGFDGSNWLATGAKPCDIVLHDGLNGGVKVKGGAEGCQVWHASRCPFHELFPVAYCQ